ncbi:MAG: phosphoenolpyruvate synthase [Patescibacteria group bacterium]
MPKKKRIIRKPKPRVSRRRALVLWFRDLTNKDVALVGGKNASLGEMIRELGDKGVAVPDGFAITALAYRLLLVKGGLKKEIKKILKDLDTHNLKDLRERGQKIRHIIREAEFPKELKQEILKAYKQMQKRYGKNVDLAIRSSATAEDLPDASFAGQQETFLNIRGEEALIESCHKCFASLFTDRAISYRQDKHFDHLDVALSIGVQKMVRSKSSGVMFSIDTETGFKNAVLINAAWGLGENIVQGTVTPDEFYVFKPTLNEGYPAIISKKLGTKKVKMIYHQGRNKPTINVTVSENDQNRYSITDKDILKLAEWAVIIEDHYKKPYDMEWAKDNDGLFIVQARPETVQSQRDVNIYEEYSLKRKGAVLTTGAPVGTKIGVGTAHIIKDTKQISKFKPGEVLVTDMTDPDWEPIMKIAGAIVTNRGGRTSHAAIVSRELGLPAIVGTDNATRVIKDGQPVTISCAEGDVGKVYKGKLPFSVKTVNLKGFKRPRTQIKMIFGTPELAFKNSQIPNDGVGLARQEFIINSYIKIHPMALVNYPKLKDKQSLKTIKELTAGYTDKKLYYVDRLSYGIAMIAAAFWPNEVIVRLSDFRSNEYAELIGGREFEPEERNPMIGWRGASRYYDEKYLPAFKLECQALKKVREKMGLTNVKVMVPFCRTVEEGKKVLEVMSRNGLKRGKKGLEVYVMCEIPSNVILADQFAEIFDGFSIGSNDLTQLVLGLDRDSELIDQIGNESNEAVKRMVAQVIKTAKEKKRHIGICGQAPSDIPEFAEFLVEEGIDSISLNPDTVIKTTVNVVKTEKRLKKK